MSENLKTIKFEDIKLQLIDELNKRLKNKSLHISEKVTIVDGFVNQPLAMELTNAFTIGGPAVPMIILVGDQSGRIYYFALKALLPNVEI